MAYKFFDKKTKGSGVTLANKSIPQNRQLAELLLENILEELLLENLKEGKYIQHSKIIFGVQI